MTFFGDNLESAILQGILNGDVSTTNNNVFYTLGLTQAINSDSLYVSLHTGNPSTDTVGTEANASGGYPGYARVAVRRENTFSPAGTKKWTITTTSGTVYAQNAEAISFPVCGSAGGYDTVTHWGLYDSDTGGNLLFHGPLTASSADWRIAYATGEDASNNTNAKWFFSRAHGFSGGDTVRCYNLYDGVPGSGSQIANLRYGTSDTIASANTDDFVLTTTVPSTTGGIMLIKSASVTLDFGKIPTIPALSLKIGLA